MVRKSILIASAVLGVLGSPLAPNSPKVPSSVLSPPIQCRTEPSLISRPKKVYTTFRALFSSLPSLEDFPGTDDADEWLETNDACFISIANVIQSIPSLAGSDFANRSLQERGVIGWLTKAPGMIQKGYKKLFKGGSKKVCKRNDDCHELAHPLVKQHGISSARLRSIRDLASKWYEQMKKEIRDDAGASKATLLKVRCLQKVVKLADTYGAQTMNAIVAAASLAEVNPGAFENNGDPRMQRALKELYDAEEVEFPEFHNFGTRIADFLRTCKEGVIPKYGPND